MSKKKTSVLFLLISVIVCFVFTFSGCQDINKMIEYYSDDSSYAEQTCTVEQMMYFPARDLRIVVYSYENKQSKYPDYYTYQVIPENERILRNNGFYKDVRIGCEITVIMAPEDFYIETGYCPPIVEVRFNDKCYLDFETGKANLLEYWSAQLPKGD